MTGVSVLDMSRILAGPWVGQLLADLGANVIKVERPGTGDDTRAWGPPFLKDRAGQDTSESAYFLCANRGKKSLTLDIARPEGRQIAGALATVSDVLIENYKVGDLERYGLDYGKLSALNPRLIYCRPTHRRDPARAARERRAGYCGIAQQGHHLGATRFCPLVCYRIR